MKKIISSILLLSAAVISNAQTTATNWTATDCNSVSHTLFTELDAGKVIVFTWVMPCNSCVAGGKAAYNAVQSFATSHPGKVLCYLADDLGDDNCSALSSWITANSIGSTSNMTIFGNAGNVINEASFGGSGMPHVIVMGGAAHQIFYNKKNSSASVQSEITSAINAAIAATTGVKEVAGSVSFAVAPNPAKESIELSAGSAISKVVISTIAGRVVKEESFQSGKASVHVSLTGLAAGMYMVRVTDAVGNSGVQKITKQ